MVEKNLKKLNIQEFVFEYKNDNFNKLKLEYGFLKYTLKNYVDGDFIEEEKPLITFTLVGVDKNKKEYTFTFGVCMSLEELNNMSDGVININDKVMQGETMLYNPYKDTWDLGFELDNDIYNKTNNCYIKKIDENKFVFKCEFVTKDLFVWFEVDFS